MSNLFYTEFCGCMTRFDPISPQQVSQLSQGRLTYSEFSEILARYGLSAKLVVHDPGRRILHTYYADYERGVYGSLNVSRGFLDEDGCACLQALSDISKCGNSFLYEKDWDAYYGLSKPISAAFSGISEHVPIPMLIYDFQKRMRDFPEDLVFVIWLAIYKRIDYANGMWAQETMDYVFKYAPDTNKPPTGENGLVRVYRGMGELSQTSERALSWSTSPVSAMYFANHSGRGTEFAYAEVAPQDIVVFMPGNEFENEVIVRPGTVRNIQYEDMLPAKEDTFVKLTAPALSEFFSYGRQARKFGYIKEGLLEFHGISHILRVLLLSLIYFYGSGDALTDADKGILVYFSLLHDVGRTDDNADENHGTASLLRIKAADYRVGGLRLTPKEYRIADIIIEYHCRDDAEGIRAINSQQGFSRKDKERAAMLYRICKDMDGLDRVRLHDLDYRKLRTEFAKRLPLIAGCLLEEDIAAALDRKTENQEVTV